MLCYEIEIIVRIAAVYLVVISILQSTFLHDSLVMALFNVALILSIMLGFMIPHIN